jgi:hypothetical protein
LDVTIGDIGVHVDHLPGRDPAGQMVWSVAYRAASAT